MEHWNSRLCIVVLAVVALVAGTSLGQESEDAPKEQPRELGLKERAASSLVQLDVSVSGEASDRLTADDFEVVVNHRNIVDFVVDRACREVRTDATTVAEASPTKPTAVLSPVAPPITYVFFLDLTHLTMEGYHRSFEMVEELIEGLFVVNAQATILSSAKELRVVTELTSDKTALLAGLAELKQDHSQFETFSEEQDSRADLVQRTRSPFAADQMARIQQQVELWAASRSLQRVSIALGRIAEIDPPKAFFYFADTMRRKTGQHYEVLAPGAGLETIAFMALASFDRIIDDASAVGVRFYAIQAQGMTGLSARNWSPARRAWNRRGVQSAQDTLASMALETGGRHFVNGVPSKTIIESVHADLHCMYLISFSPEGFPLDEGLPVRVQSKRPGTTATARGRLVIQSESANRQTRLIAAFATGYSDGMSRAIEARIVPTGFVDGKYTALVQVAVPGSQIPDTTWDIGVSLLTRGRVRDDASGRIASVAPGTPLVFEHVMEFAPGPFELSAVAHETTTDQVLSARLDGEWPDPNEANVTVIPPSMMQPMEAIFLRDEQLKRSSGLSFGVNPALHKDRPIAILGLICRGKGNRKTLAVERSLIGASTVRFEPLELTDASDRCTLYRDIVVEKTLGIGGFKHEVRVSYGKDQQIVQTAGFQVVPAE